MGDRRTTDRRRTRLRPGKLLDRSGVFLVDCTILDRSARGLRIRILDAVVPPGECRLVDEGEGTCLDAVLVWRQGGLAGLKAASEPERLAARVFRETAGPYYATR